MVVVRGGRVASGVLGVVGIMVGVVVFEMKMAKVLKSGGGVVVVG